MSKYEEYLICKERGHVSTGTSFQTAMLGSVPHYECRYCGTEYWTVTTSKDHENKVPTEANGEK